jgi:DNA-binding transcriptional ArsR family regulator
MNPTDAVFSALADPTRREVIRRLSQQASMTATELAEVLPVSRQAIAKHLAELEQAHLVAGERVGRENRFRLTPAPMAEAVSWMASMGAQWDERLSRLGRHLEGDRGPAGA